MQTLTSEIMALHTASSAWEHKQKERDGVALRKQAGKENMPSLPLLSLLILSPSLCPTPLIPIENEKSPTRSLAIVF